jgi:hypothetical protein
MFLDSRPSNPNRALQMETQYVPSALATDKNGVTYARVAPTSFSRGADGKSTVVHRVTAYNKAALWDSVKEWFDGGKPASGIIKPQESAVHSFRGGGGATWRISTPRTSREERVRLAWSSFATPIAPDPVSYGFEWNSELTTKKDAKDGPLVGLPEYYRLAKDGNGKTLWVVVQPEDVPAETGLAEARFGRPAGDPLDAYVTPDDAASCWKTPGPVAGPFEAHPGDGSTVTYYWYRFADQPAILNADLTDEEREKLQERVEMLHRHWKKDGQYLPAPTTGELADLDPALIVTPPKGLEVGYVPIATRQGIEE